MAGRLDVPVDAKVVLLDIEGTVCPISFVKDVLFPYALSALPQTLAEQWDAPAFVPYREAFPAEYRQSPEALQTHVQELMAKDVKIAYLKSLQGYLWQSGYAAGSLSCPLFDDVFPSLKSWSSLADIHIIIYSSGSVAAQKLLFQYTNSGDIRSLITDYFDTVNAGLKHEPASYEKIVKAHSSLAPPASWLFLSDNVKEVDAARKAGLQAAVVVREGNAPLSEEAKEKNLVITSFEQVRISGI
ncbi:Enolase-phosphatase E1 [Phlyctema vagabunda]|uniref:Enolase-phosphatase E1 n=1 Tax=Phlyctema vagabunda TaxID=108571 RepID=A0ABR4PUM3_9HELO